jgi:pimeloyl-ACP methyl ester carboxylesterase
MVRSFMPSLLAGGWTYSWAAFERTVCPIHILRAETDSPGRIDGHTEALTATGRVRIDTMPGTTHFLPMEPPELVREATWQVVRAP